MKRLLSLVVCSLFASVCQAENFPPTMFPSKAIAPAADQPHVDIVFCIDRSGSMSGVIETAKKKVWSIVNEIAKAKPSPVLRIGLIGYGSGEKLSHELPLTDDLDEVYKHLTTYHDDAGGDEYVGYVINVASERMKWADGKQVLKIIYVIGNETARQGPSNMDYAKTAPAAIAKGIMVNAIYCGNGSTSETETWKETAKLADGQYLQIAGDGGAVVVATPFDKELSELNAKLNSTYVAFGSRAAGGAANQSAQDSAAASLSPAVLAERTVAKAAPQYSNSTWDLVDAAKAKDFDLKKLKAEEIPEEMRKLDDAGKKAYLDKKSKERADLQKAVRATATKRDAFVKAEADKAAKSGKPADSLDGAIRDSLRKQAEQKGFAFDEK